VKGSGANIGHCRHPGDPPEARAENRPRGRPFPCRGGDIDFGDIGDEVASYGIQRRHFGDGTELTTSCPRNYNLLPRPRGERVREGQFHFRGEDTIWRGHVLRAAIIGTVPCERLPADLSPPIDVAAQ